MQKRKRFTCQLKLLQAIKIFVSFKTSDAKIPENKNFPVHA